MGGYGSGRPGTMATVEDCLTLDLDDLFRKGLVGETFNVHNQRLIWTNVRTGEELSSIQYSFYEIDKTEKRMNLNYTNTARDGEKTKVEIPIRLECTYPLYGGKRWWFTCPLSRGGIACGKRVNKLHSRAGCPYFGCRVCLNLTYTSCNESHQFDLLYASLAVSMGSTPERVKAALKDGDDSYMNHLF